MNILICAYIGMIIITGDQDPSAVNRMTRFFLVCHVSINFAFINVFFRIRLTCILIRLEIILTIFCLKRYNP